MAMNHGNTAQADYVLCPYFVDHGDSHIICEGFMDGVCRTRHNFRYKREKEKHLAEYCQKYDWEMCEYALCLSRFKYGDEK